jgi:S-methylmethionine-dependent homocysteine/selenocysteine methylase
MENIRIYNPHSKFTNEIAKMAKASVAQINMVGGCCEIKNPTRRAITRKNTNRSCIRTVFV